MNDIINMLREAFKAGMDCAAAYEHGTYAIDFKKWHEENKKEIEHLPTVTFAEYQKTYNNLADHDRKLGEALEELASLKEVVKELIPIAEVFERIYFDPLSLASSYQHDLKAVIERAKTLIR